MSLALEKIKAAAFGGTLAYEMARMEEERSSWRKAMLETDLIGKQVRELAESSAYAQVAKELKALQSPAMSIAQQYQDLLGPSSAIESAFKSWQESGRVRMKQMRKRRFKNTYLSKSNRNMRKTFYFSIAITMEFLIFKSLKNF